MENQNKQIALSEIGKTLNQSVQQVLGATAMEGFEKAYQIADAISALKEALTADYMKPIMALQGNKLGFKTDKDSKGGYDVNQVKNCVIEAVLMGVQPFNNQFNIIAGNTYITKEGFGYLLSKIQGLNYQIIPALPRINGQSAAVVMKMKWTINGVTKEQDLDIPIKVNEYMGADAVIGKATRKARAWLYNTITGSEISDGDASDFQNAEVISSTTNHSIEDLQLLFDMKKEALTADEVSDATRILTNKEANSYSKLHALLMTK